MSRDTDKLFEISEVEMLRDGGTVLFRLNGCDRDGLYRLETPFAGEPRILSHDGTRLQPGSIAECCVARYLERWLEPRMSPQVVHALAELDRLPEWKNLPEHLLAAVALHRILAVAEYLRRRCREAFN